MMSGRQISDATLLKWVRRLHQALAGWKRAAMERLLEIPVLHADETSIRVNRKNHWIHSCSFADLAVKKCHRKRGAKAVDAINIIPRLCAPGSCDDNDAQKPVLVHDRWATYFKYDNVVHALCGAHLSRNLKHIEKAHRHRWAQNMRRLPLDAFKTYETEILRFACRSEVPFSNSRAECDIRMAKVKQKVSGTFRNLNHAQAYCRISSCLQSMSCQGYNSLAAVQIALNGNAVQMLDPSK